MKKIIIIGGGAAGMLAGIIAARNGNNVEIFEKNEKLGKKLFITGKGRCNLTNDCSMEDFLSSVMSNNKFMYSAFSGFTSQDMMDLIESLGCPLKVERGNRVFPVSDHSSDIIKALTKGLKDNNVKVNLFSEVQKLIIKDNAVKGVVVNNENKMADAVIVATGGLSYKTTGSTGDGMRFAEKAGLKVTDCRPSIVPMECREDYIKELQGLSLKNIKLSVYDGKKELYSEQGELMLTHYGISGPLALRASAIVGDKLYFKKKELKAFIDLKPALSFESLDKRLIREFSSGGNSFFKNSLNSLFPSKLIPVMVKLSGIAEDKPINEITRAERENFGKLIKAFPFTLTGLRDYNEAVITAGGVSVKEINPKTMAAKKIENLYFAGEVLDVDAMTGGYNLQIAFSTAFAAANSI